MSELPPEHRNLIPGYELIRKLGQGGMGAVFQARQISMDRMVALKVLPRNLAKKEKFKARFFREARAAGRLNHPNIVQALDAQEAGGYSYLAMELVEGISLQKRLKEAGRLPEREALQIVRQIADALDHAWTRHKIVHRDIKPENILYTASGMAKLCDMGIARISTDAAMTQEGATLGTPSYISPEQARGSHDIDTRADIYSLGATLFHLLTGETPYQGNTSAAIIVKHIREPVPSAHVRCPEVGEAASALVARMMQKDPADRYQEPSDVVADIDRVLSGKSPVHVSGRQVRIPSVRLSAESVSAVREKVKPYARQIRYAAYAVGGIVFLSLLVFILRAVFSASPPPLPDDPTRIVRDAPPETPPVDPVVEAWERAGAHETAGRLEAARSAYHELAQRFPRSGHGQAAREKVNELDLRLGSPDAPDDGGLPDTPDAPVTPDAPDALDDSDDSDDTDDTDGTVPPVTRDSPSRRGNARGGHRERAARDALQELRGRELPPQEYLVLLQEFAQAHAGTQAADRALEQIDQTRGRIQRRAERRVLDRMENRRVESIRTILETGEEARILPVLSRLDALDAVEGPDGDMRPLRPLAGSLERLAGHASDAALREVAMRLLVGVDREAGERAILRRLRDRNENVRLAAIELAKKHRIESAAGDLTTMGQKDPSPRVRAALEP